MKKLILLKLSYLLLLGISFSYNQIQVDEAIDVVMSKYDTNTQLLKLNNVIPKIGKIQLSNPPKETWDILKLIENSVRNRIEYLLKSQFVLDISPPSNIEVDMFKIMNEYRTNKGLSTLSYNGKLGQAAQLLADDMAAQDYFTHVSPQGVGYIQRLAVVNYDFDYVSENLGLGEVEASLIVKLRSESPIHAKNLFSKEAEHVGVGYNTSNHYWVAVYASPLD